MCVLCKHYLALLFNPANVLLCLIALPLRSNLTFLTGLDECVLLFNLINTTNQLSRLMLRQFIQHKLSICILEFGMLYFCRVLIFQEKERVTSAE